MKNKIEILEERLVALQNIIGDIDTTDIGSKTTGSVLFKDKMNNISDIIVRLQKEISENDSITFKDINKKCI